MSLCGIERFFLLLREMLNVVVQLVLLVRQFVGPILRLLQLLLLSGLILLASLLVLKIRDAIGKISQMLRDLLRVIVAKSGIVLNCFLQLLHRLGCFSSLRGFLLGMLAKPFAASACRCAAC